MNKKWHVQRGLFLCSVIVFVGCFMAEEFLLERKKKKLGVSTTVLREQCAQEIGDILQIIPDIMHGLANMQSANLSHICAFFDGEKQCFLLSAKKDQLYNLQKELTVHKKRLIVIEQALQEQVLFLQSLEPKKSKSNKSSKNGK